MINFLSTVRSRIILVLVTCTAIMLAVGGFGMYGLSALSDWLHDSYVNTVIPIDKVTTNQADMLKGRLALWRMIAQKDKSAGPQINALLAQMDKDWKRYYTDTSMSGDERAVAEKIDGLLPQYRTAVEKEMTFVDQGDFDKAAAWQATDLLPIGESITSLLEQDVKINTSEAKDSDVEGAALAARLKWISTALILCGALLSFGAAVYLIRAVTRPLDKAVSIASEIAQGRLDKPIVVDVAGEFGQLLEAMKTMSRQLATTILGIRNGSESVTVASEQIAAGNHDLSSRTEEQAASLEQTAASMSQLTETVNQNASNARQANSLAANAREMTDAGSTAVGTMVATMQEISADSARIAEITGMIEGIAFQTNILALNAAVEAARAGEQGRGFAVVAGEVRSLAQRASAAAKDIKELIEVSSGKVRQGAQQAGDVGATMDKVIQAISRVSDIVGEISAASDEQSKGIQQVHQAINQIDEVTQQNAALVEEATAAAQSLQEQATKMTSDVMFFRLGNESSSHQRIARPQPAQKRTDAQETTKPAQSVRPIQPVRPARSVKAVAAGAAVAAERPEPVAATGGNAADWETF